MAASSAAGVAAGERQHHELEIFVRVAMRASMAVIMVVIVFMIVVVPHARARHARAHVVVLAGRLQ